MISSLARTETMESSDRKVRKALRLEDEPSPAAVSVATDLRRASEAIRMMLRNQARQEFEVLDKVRGMLDGGYLSELVKSVEALENRIRELEQEENSELARERARLARLWEVYEVQEKELVRLQLVEHGSVPPREWDEATLQVLVGASFGANPWPSAFRRVVPVAVYLPRGGHSQLAVVREAVSKVVVDCGLLWEASTVYGSIFQRWWLQDGKSRTGEELRKMMEETRRALELAALHKPQAEADRNQAEGAAALIKSLERENEAVVLIGSILILKLTTNGASRIMTRTLSQTELMEIQSTPGRLSDMSAVRRLFEPPIEVTTGRDSKRNPERVP